MAKTINLQLPDKLQRELAHDRVDSGETNSEIGTEAFAEYYGIDPEDAREWLENEVNEDGS
jgi:hypothetical protein